MIQPVADPGEKRQCPTTPGRAHTWAAHTWAALGLVGLDGPHEPGLWGWMASTSLGAQEAGRVEAGWAVAGWVEAGWVEAGWMPWTSVGRGRPGGPDKPWWGRRALDGLGWGQGLEWGQGGA
ncbi:hypothetical protein GCM10029964_121090 [Kibdelosporangium lantanae]